eukprot:14484880-Alexandrium_andersonii.AAC.1
MVLLPKRSDPSDGADLQRRASNTRTLTLSNTDAKLVAASLAESLNGAASEAVSSSQRCLRA